MNIVPNGRIKIDKERPDCSKNNEVPFCRINLSKVPKGSIKMKKLQ